MTKYIRLDKAIEEIRKHGERIGSENEVYQLAHYHIIKLLENIDYIESEDMDIGGYRAKDLVITAERLRKDNIDRYIIKADNAAFMEGYTRAQEEFKQSLEDCVNNIVNNFGNN